MLGITLINTLNVLSTGYEFALGVFFFFFQSNYKEVHRADSGHAGGYRTRTRHVLSEGVCVLGRFSKAVPVGVCGRWDCPVCGLFKSLSIEMYFKNLCPLFIAFIKEQKILTSLKVRYISVHVLATALLLKVLSMDFNLISKTQQ